MDETFDDAEAPENFTLEAERSRQDEAASAGIHERDDEPEPDDLPHGESELEGRSEDDDVVDGPDDEEVGDL